jgi:hypothetical protein
LEPTAGAPGLLVLGLATAGVVALGFGAGATGCANASPIDAPAIVTTMAAAKKYFMLIP